MHKSSKEIKRLSKTLKTIQKTAIKNGLIQFILCDIHYKSKFKTNCTKIKIHNIIILPVVVVLALIILFTGFFNSLLSARCLLPSHYFVWEATRPLADCTYCINVTKPIILYNITQNDFMNSFAYSSKPIIVKNACNKWKAIQIFSFNMLKRLYEKTVMMSENVDESCQFLNFKTDLYSIREVFQMPSARARNDKGQKPWYVGWGSCHPQIVNMLRKYYSSPDFLPVDAEFPETENIFFGYEMGAVMHVKYIGFMTKIKYLLTVYQIFFIFLFQLDYIPRLMWQGQVRGNKTWSVAPVYECEDDCHKFKYYVEPGDIVLLDTRLWYHETRIPKGQFSLTVQSEYG